VLSSLAERPPPGRLEEVSLAAACGRVLARPVRADRDQPPFHRSTRDGFAVRAADVAGATEASPVALQVVGEVPAGAVFAGQVGPGQAVEIMTGAPLPAGADAVVMVEHTTRPAPGTVLVARPLGAGDHFVPQGSELPAGAEALPAGRMIDPAAVGLLASLGCARPAVFARPRVAILGTGDEIVPVDVTPGVAQIRNSNEAALSAQIARAGGDPVPLGVAPDERAPLEAALRAAFAAAELVLVTGGVSMGKYDLVEPALAALGARVLFDGVAIRPGRPLVFGWVGDTPFFGLPGNPLSALVTFELFVRPALARLAGAPPAPLRLAAARLAEAVRQRPVPLTVFLPAELVEAPDGEEALVRPLPSQGSGDLGAMARADVLIALPPGTERLDAGSWVRLLPK
jgi:molybdopterin molybdotransferase